MADPPRTPGGWLQMAKKRGIGSRMEGEAGKGMESGLAVVSGREQASVHLGPPCPFSPVYANTNNPFSVFSSWCTVSKAFHSTFSTLYASYSALYDGGLCHPIWWISTSRLTNVRGPWSHIAIKGKEGPCTSVVLVTGEEEHSVL